MPNGIPTEFFQQIQRGLGGLGPGILQAGLMRREETLQEQQRRRDLFTKMAQYRDIKEGVEVPPELQEYADIAQMFGPRVGRGEQMIGEELATLFKAQGLNVTADMTLNEVDALRKQRAGVVSAGLRRGAQEIQITGQLADIAKVTYDDIQQAQLQDINMAKLKAPENVSKILEQNSILEQVLKQGSLPNEALIEEFRTKKRRELEMIIQNELPYATSALVKEFVASVLRNKKKYGIK